MRRLGGNVIWGKEFTEQTYWNIAGIRPRFFVHFLYSPRTDRISRVMDCHIVETKINFANVGEISDSMIFKMIIAT